MQKNTQKKIYLLLAIHALFLSACSTPIAPSSSSSSSSNINKTTLDDYLKKNQNNLNNPTNPTNPTNPSNPNNQNTINIQNPNLNLNLNQNLNQGQSLDWLPLPSTNINNAPLSATNIPFNQLLQLQPQPQSQPQSPTSTYTPNYAFNNAESEFEQAIAQDSLDGFWPAWLANCQKLSQQAKWQPICRQAYGISANDIATQKQYLKQYFNPQKLNLRAAEQSKITGYYEPLLKGSRLPTATYRYPIYQKPNPTYTQYGQYAQYGQPAQSAQNYQSLTRQQLLQSPFLQGRELIYLANPVDAALIEIQGSALIELDEGQNIPQNTPYANFNAYQTYQIQSQAQPKPPASWVRVAFDGSNQHNFKSFIQYLLNKKYISRSEMAIPPLRIWALQNPYLIQEAIQSNPRFIFFKNIEYNQGGPMGAYGLALTPQRSIAVDTNYIELGTPVLIKFNHPILGLMQRFVIAQDVGNAIKGSVRADFFWGLGEDALKLANATNTEGELLKLLPKY